MTKNQAFMDDQKKKGNILVAGLSGGKVHAIIRGNEGVTLCNKNLGIYPLTMVMMESGQEVTCKRCYKRLDG